MAQIKIKKYNTGGTLYTETGEAFTLEQVEQLVRENPTNENLKDIANELRAGRDVNHSISDNWSSVTDSDFNAGQKRRIARNPNSFGRRLAATFNTRVHQYGEDVNDTTAILSAASRKAASSNGTGTGTGTSNGNEGTNPDDYTLISSGGGAQFVYDDNGAFASGDFTNARLISLLNNLNNYFADDNGGASYKFRGISADVRRTLKDMYDANPNLFNDLIAKVKAGQIVEGSPEASVLTSIGIGSNVTKDQLAQAQKDKALKDYFVGKGFTEDQYKDFLQFVELDGQGLKLKAGVEGGPFIAGQNYYFNDDYNGAFKDLLKGQILFNNRFYNAEQLAGSGMITDWVKALREHRFADADSMIKWDWTGDQVDNYDYQLFDNQNFYNEFLDGKRYLDVTGQYEKTYDDDGNLYQIMGYYDPNDSGNYTALGFVDPSKIKYARFDSMGNLVDENYNTAMLRRAANPWSHESSFQGRRSDGQVEIPTITTRNGRGVLGMDVTFDPDKGTVQFHGAAVQNVLGAENGNTIELDGEIAQILSPEFFANLEHSNKRDLNKFKDTILSLVGTDTGNNIMRNQLSRREWIDLLRPTYGDQANYYGNMLFQYFKEYLGGTSGFRKIMRNATSPFGLGPFTNWGSPSRQSRIHEFTPKHQHGGLFTGSAAAASSAPRVVQSDKYIPATTEEAGAFQFGEFTNADWMELAGLGADLSSVVTGMAGLTPASVATGLVGTGATFMADINRDGFQMKDLGNLGLGLLFDAASLVPGLGVAASTGQVVKTLKKGLPVLMKLAGIAGIGSSLSLAVSKIQSGEKLTMKDLRILMNGVLGAYTMAKQGVGFKDGKANGKTIDVDVQKMHMDEIDASNLSDGQKAAMRHFFDDTYNPTGLSPEQKAIYDRFIADGGDESALKMLIGDDEVFKSIRADRELLERVKQSLTGGPALSDADLAKYNKLVESTQVRSRMTAEQRAAMSNMDVENQELANLLKIANDPAASPAVRANAEHQINTRFRHDATGTVRPEYKEFFEKWDAMPSRSRYDELDDLLRTTTTEYHAGMFTKKNPLFGRDADWAATVKQQEADANKLLQSRADYDAADATVKALEKERRTLRAKSKLTKKEQNRLTEIANELTVARNNRKNAIADISDWETQALAKGLEKDPVTGAWIKSKGLLKDVETVRTQFDPVTGAKTRTQLQDEFDLLDADASRAELDLKRKTTGDQLIDDYLSGDGSKRITKKWDDVVESEYSNLSDAEKAEVSSILKKNIDDLNENEIAKLNYYTAKQHGVVDAEADAVFAARRTQVEGDDAFQNFKLGEDVGIDKVSALLRKSGIPKGKVKLSETEWAKIKKADDQVAAFKAVLQKKGVKDDVIKKIESEVFVEVEKPADSEGWTLFGRRKKSSTSSTTTTPQQPDFKIDESKFVDRPGKADNTLKGRILGHSKKQRAYKRDLYGIGRKRTDLKNMPHRYYQPMIHGLHYNLLRDPVHHTPWYEPKEITIQIENEEE